MRCFQCGRPVTGSEDLCTVCGVCLLVDIVVDNPVADPKAVYAAARAIDALPEGVGDFSSSKRILENAPGVLVRSCNRNLARNLGAILKEKGIGIRIVPVRKPSKSSQPRGTLSGFLFGLRTQYRRLPGKTGPALLIGIAVVTIAGLLALGHDRPGGNVQNGNPSAHPSAVVSIQEAAFAVLPATARLRSERGDSLGFFVTPDRLVTCTQIFGPQTSTASVTLADGSTLQGQVENLDQWLGVVTVRVPGAHAAILPLGDAMALEPGTTVLAVDNPLDYDPRITQGVVKTTRRITMGVANLEISTTFTTRACGGPILDRGARVVGVTIGPDSQSSGSSLVLPANYLYSGPTPPLKLKQEPPENPRFQTLLDEAELLDRKSLASILSRSSQPALIGAAQGPAGTLEAVLVRVGSTGPTGPESFSFRLIRGGVEMCRPEGRIDWWQSTTDVPLSPSRYLGQLARHDMLSQTLVGLSALNLDDCPSELTLAGALLVLSNADPSADRAMIGIRP